MVREPYPGDDPTFSLAFVTALQHLQPKHRAALLLHDVLGFGADEVAVMLDAPEQAVRDYLRRARLAMRVQLPLGPPAPPPRSELEAELAGRFATAFAADDVDGVLELLAEDAWLTLPPGALRYRGRTAIGEFLATAARSRAGRRYRLIPVRANGQPAFGCYLPDSRAAEYHAHGMIVLTLSGTQISAITRFTGSVVLPRFALPETLPEQPG